MCADVASVYFLQQRPMCCQNFGAFHAQHRAPAVTVMQKDFDFKSSKAENIFKYIRKHFSDSVKTINRQLECLRSKRKVRCDSRLI